jgi:hypothetical protein
MRRLIVVALTGAISAAVLPAAQSAPDIPLPTTFSQFKVTNPNSDQQAEVEKLRILLASRDMETSGIGVYVVPEADGPTTYVTRSPKRFEVRRAGDAYSVLPTADALPMGLGGVRTSTPVASGASWALNNEDCFRIGKDWFSRWVCWEIDEQHGDSDAGRHYWQYSQEASGSSVRSWKMKRLWVEGKPHEQSAPMKFDGIPEPKESSRKTENCDSVSDTLSVSGGRPVTMGFSRTWNRITCERYEARHYDDHAHWATVWEGKPVSKDHTRHVIFTMPVSTVEGQQPRWYPWSGQERD